VYLLFGIYLHDGIGAFLPLMPTALVPEAVMVTLMPATNEPGRAALTMMHAAACLAVSVAGYFAGLHIAAANVVPSRGEPRNPSEKARRGLPLSGLLGVIGLIAVGLGLVQFPSDIAATCFLTLTIATLTVATLTCIVSNTANHLRWGGFAVLGWIYLLLNVHLLREIGISSSRAYTAFIPALILSKLVPRTLDATSGHVILNSMVALIAGVIGYVATPIATHCLQSDRSGGPRQAND
jgi:hypothetical protein